MHIWLQLKPVILQINLLYIYTLAGRGHAATRAAADLPADLAEAANCGHSAVHAAARTAALPGLRFYPGRWIYPLTCLAAAACLTDTGDWLACTYGSSHGSAYVIIIDIHRITILPTAVCVAGSRDAATCSAAHRRTSTT